MKCGTGNHIIDLWFEWFQLDKLTDAFTLTHLELNTLLSSLLLLFRMKCSMLVSVFVFNSFRHCLIVAMLNAQ